MRKNNSATCAARRRRCCYRKGNRARRAAGAPVFSEPLQSADCGSCRLPSAV